VQQSTEATNQQAEGGATQPIENVPFGLKSVTRFQFTRSATPITSRPRLHP